MTGKERQFTKLIGFALFTYCLVNMNNFLTASERKNTDSYMLRIFYSGDMLGYLEPCG